ncbi:hypothetical protein E8E12_006932 [Didymella heteroderae]|uniref:AA9 family lytic polysaccharide monooxygenase n=1 Tax=Didymella heteroderae TaxID=1769908 RepID=A0A9P4WLN9_9PLEO|nr:hypothetical protein E8E12_006932 [Didymella heteroderae]
MKMHSFFLAALVSTPLVFAHTAFTDFFVNGMPQGDGVAMRMNPNPGTVGSPIGSLNSDDMACNVGGTKGVSRVQPVPDGALITFEIRSSANDPSKHRLSRSHHGPCAVYLKKVASAVEDKAVGDGWFKLFDHGYDASTKRWCTDDIIDNNGLLSVRLPKGLEGGYYLARPEILALHSASAGDPQVYTGCAQIFLESSGNLGPESTVAIPGHMKYGVPSTNFNIYVNKNAEYRVPGPSVAKLVAKSGQAGAPTSTQTEGLRPEGCVVENANWCGKEVSPYSDARGCWAASKQCWAQGKTCWASMPPTGGAGCELWQNKCKGIDDACNAKRFNGPPNRGRVLTPQKKKIDVGLEMATRGSVSAAPTRTAPASTTALASKTTIASTTAHISRTVAPIVYAASITTRVSHSKPSAHTATQAHVAPFSEPDSSATLHEPFTISSFIAWLKQKTRTTDKTHRHARSFRL